MPEAIDEVVRRQYQHFAIFGLGSKNHSERRRNQDSPVEGARLALLVCIHAQDLLDRIKRTNPRL